MPLPERCYSMDVRHPLMVVGTAERKICVYDLSSANWQQPYRVEDSPLKHQTRCVRAFPDKEGFAIGSIALILIDVEALWNFDFSRLKPRKSN